MFYIIFFLAFELHFSYINPVHFFNRLFKQQTYNYIPESLIFIICALVLIIDVCLYSGETTNEETSDSLENSIAFMVLGKWKGFIIIILCVASLVFCFKINSKIQKFCFKNQEKLYYLISKRKMSNFLYLIYGFLYVLPVVSNVKIAQFYNVFGSIIFMIILCNDFIIHISIISTTKFCEYGLKRTLLGYFCNCFFNPSKYNSSTTPLVNESSINEVAGITTFQNDTPTALNINTNNPRDKELVLIYKNGIFLEDYFYYYFDQILNIITISIYHAYNSSNFSSQANEQRLSTNIKIDDMSSIGGTMQSMTISNIGNNNNNKTVINSINYV